MKVLFKSFYLYFLGVVADSHKRVFNKAVDRAIMRGGDISSRRLTRMSDRSYRLYLKFREIEKDVNYKLSTVR